MQGSFGPRLVVDALEMIRYTLVYDVHPICDLAGRVSQHDEVHYLTLAFAQYGVGFHCYASPHGSLIP